MRRSVLPRSVARTGPRIPRRDPAPGGPLRSTAGRAAAALLVLAALTGCVRVGEPLPPRPTVPTGQQEAGTVVDGGMPPLPAGGAARRGPDPSASGEDEAEEDAKNGDDRPSASPSPSRRPGDSPGPRPGDDTPPPQPSHDESSTPPESSTSPEPEPSSETDSEQTASGKEQRRVP